MEIQIFQDLLAAKTNIKAVTYVPAGTRLIIYPKIDLWLRTAERERSDAYAKNAMGKPEQLIDDSDPMGSIHRGNKSGGNNSSDSSTSSKVVYSGDDADVQATPLIDDGAYARKREQQRRQQMGAVPPPPSMTTTGGSGNNNQTNSDASLF